MQNIKKPRRPSGQLLETVNFAFIKIFDFLVKIAFFRASLLFLGDSRHAFPPGSRVQLHIELNKGGKRTFANFQAKTQYFRSRF